MNLSSRIIKAQDVKLTGSLSGKIRVPPVPTQVNTGTPVDMRHERAVLKREAPVRFRGVCHLPEKDAGFNAHENHRENSAEIEKIRKQAKERIKIAEKEAYDRGCSEGRRDGIDQKNRELSLSSQSVAKLIRELEDLKKQILEDSEKEILDLAFLIAGKVIHKEVSTGREVILSVLRDAMRNMQESEGVRIRLHPGDYRHIIEVKPDFLERYGDISIEKDEGIGQGGAMIETNSGSVDARLDKQLNKIMESLCDEH